LETLHDRRLEESIQLPRNAHRAPPSLLRLIRSTQQLFPDRAPALLQKLPQPLDRHPAHTGTSLVGLDARQCRLAVSPLAGLLDQLLVFRWAFRPLLRH
jgi:hypothetical protein